MNRIHVGVSLTTAFDVTWEEGNRPYCRMQTHGWTDAEELSDSLLSHASRSGNRRCNGWGWSTSTEVRDGSGQELPETMFVVIYCSGVYYSENSGRTEYGGGHGSWGVEAAFTDREKAEAFVNTKTEKWRWLWVVGTSRFNPSG